MSDDEGNAVEIDENSSELEIVRFALGCALDIISRSEIDFDGDSDPDDLEFCGRIFDASEAGDMTEIRREIAEMGEDDNDDS